MEGCVLTEEKIQELKDFLETLANDYTTYNDYGRSYDHYYTMYSASGETGDPENIHNKAQYFLDCLDNLNK